MDAFEEAFKADWVRRTQNGALSFEDLKKLEKDLIMSNAKSDSNEDWRKLVPTCLGGEDADNLQDMVWAAVLELDLIKEGQEAATHYSKKEIEEIRKFIQNNQSP